MKSNRIELHIDTLVLDGAEAGTERRIRLALERELTRLLSDDAASIGATGHRYTVDAGDIGDPSATDPETAGKALARALHRSLSR